MEKMTRSPTHPGLVFKTTVLEENNITVSKAAVALGLSRTTMSKFCNGRTPCRPDIAQRIALSIGSNVALWINLQANYDAWFAENSEKPHVEKLLNFAA
jgi:addiction module HigA family antidote